MEVEIILVGDKRSPDGLLGQNEDFAVLLNSLI